MVSGSNIQPPNVVVSFDVNDIGWATGRALYTWWGEARGERKFPARRDFKPATVKNSLPNILLIDISESQADYSIRLIGTRATEVIGFDPTGKALEYVPNTQQLIKSCDWIVKNKKPILRTNLSLPWSNNELHTCSVLMLPLGPEGEQVRMLLLHYHFEAVGAFG